MDRSRIWSMSSNSGSANAHRSGDEALVAGSLLNRLQEDVGEASTPRRQGEHGHFEGLKVPGDTSGHDTLTGNAESGRSAFLRRDAVWAGKVSSDKFRGGLENQNIAGERVAYRECQRNHSVENGTTAYDGCGEFMAAGKDGTADALKCSVCGCHRNFHHRVIEDKGEIPSSRLEGNADQTLLSSIERVASDINQVLPLIKKTKRKDSVLAEQKLGEILELIVKMILTVTDWLALSQKSMKPDQERISLQVLPPLVGSYDHGLKDEVADPSTIKQISSPEHQTASRERSDDSIPRKKRKRTKFTSEQLTKLESLANSVGWVLGSLTKEQQEAASEEIGIKIDSLKYWFHNTKQKKKHEDGQP